MFGRARHGIEISRTYARTEVPVLRSLENLQPRKISHFVPVGIASWPQQPLLRYQAANAYGPYLVQAHSLLEAMWKQKQLLMLDARDET